MFCQAPLAGAWVSPPASAGSPDRARSAAAQTGTAGRRCGPRSERTGMYAPIYLERCSTGASAAPGQGASGLPVQHTSSTRSGQRGAPAAHAHAPPFGRGARPQACAILGRRRRRAGCQAQAGRSGSRDMAYVIGVLIAAAVLVGSATAVLVAIARVEEILPPPTDPGTGRREITPRRAFHPFPRDRQTQ